MRRRAQGEQAAASKIFCHVPLPISPSLLLDFTGFMRQLIDRNQLKQA
jgi:hypothetical protein